MKPDRIITGVISVLFLLSGIAPSALGEEGLFLRLGSSAFELTDGGIEMDGFGYLSDPGKPRLPARTYLYLMPPGARVIGVELIDAEISPLPGRHRIEAASPILDLSAGPDASERHRETWIQWESDRRIAYASDAPYPTEPVWIVGSGGLREYSYVALRFAPFTYHPYSGRLVHHRSVDVEVRYRLPNAGGEEEKLLARLLPERVADAKAARLFENFESMAPLYEVTGGEREEIHDYVIITDASFESAVLASGFVEWKTSLGYSVRIVRLSDPEIAGQPGADLPERIRNFLREHYGLWGIEYVLLVGGHDSLPMRYCFPNPENHEHNPDSPGNYGGSAPTDSYYADLSLSVEESWDLDGDGYLGEHGEDAPDFLAEVSVGRIPTDDPLRITYALNKIVRFEQDTGDWKDRALHGGAILFYENQDGMDIPFRDGADCMDIIETTSMNGWTINHYCEHEGLVPSGYDWPALTQSIFTFAWRSGRWGMVNWAGHGSSDAVWRHIWTWDDGDGVFETDGSDGYEWESFLTDDVDLEDDYPSIVWAVSCSVGRPEDMPNGNLGMDLLTRPGFGAAAGVISATRTACVSRYWPDDPGGTESMCCEFNRFLINGPDGPELLGDAHFDSKFYCFVNYGWDSWKEYIDQYDFNVYGDPAMARKGPILTSVEELDPETPAAAAILYQNRPNPFNPRTTIRYDLPEAAKVRLTIYDIEGRRVRVLEDGSHLSAGSHHVVWDGRDEAGRLTSSGMYLYRLEVGAFEQTNHMVLIK